MPDFRLFSWREYDDDFEVYISKHAISYLRSLDPVPEETWRATMWSPLNEDMVKKVMTEGVIGDAPLPTTGAEFPDDIAQVIFCQEGMGFEGDDQENWFMVGKLTCGWWFFFNATCAFSGFDVGGDMSCIAASTLERLEFALPRNVRSGFAQENSEEDSDSANTDELYY